VAEEVLDEDRVGVAGHQASGAVAETVELHVAQARRLARGVVAPSDGGCVQAAPQT
jgi:hypothetical protein